MDHWLSRENKSNMNFANLATFQSIEFVDRVVPKIAESLCAGRGYRTQFLKKVSFQNSAFRWQAVAI